jgi:hypothetical protein
MSEFSDSYHLLNSDVGRAVRLVRATGRYAVVIPPAKRHVPFFVEGIDEAGGPMDSVLAHNPGVLLHYSFSDDHGCWIRVYECSEALATLSFVEPGNLRPDNHPIALNGDNMAQALATLQMHGVLDTGLGSRLNEIARTVSLSAVGPLVAQVLDLEHVRWAGCADLTHKSQRELRERWPEARFVNVKQRGKAKGTMSLDELMALPIPVVSLDPAPERMVERHFAYWTEFGDFDETTQLGYWMYEHYNSLLPSRYRYLTIQLMNCLYRDKDRVRRVLRAILGLCGSQDWERLLRGF